MHTLADTYRIVDGGLAEYVRCSSAIEFSGQAVSARDCASDTLLEEIGRQRETVLSASRDVLDASSFVREPWQVVRDCQATSDHISQSEPAWNSLKTSALRDVELNGSAELAAARLACSEASQIQASLGSTQADLLCAAADAFNARHISQEAVFSECGQLDATCARYQQETIADVLSSSGYLAGHADAWRSPDPFSLSEACRQFNERNSISEILRSQTAYEADRLWLHAQPSLITGPDSSRAAIRFRNSPANDWPWVRAETPSISDFGALDDETPPAKSDLGKTSEADLPSPPVRHEVRAVQIVTSLCDTFELAAVPLPDDESLLQESLDLLAMHLVAHYPSHELAILLRVVRVDLALKVLFAPQGPVTRGRTEALNTDDYEVAEEASASLLALVRHLKR